MMVFGFSKARDLSYTPSGGHGSEAEAAKAALKPSFRGAQRPGISRFLQSSEVLHASPFYSATSLRVSLCGAAARRSGSGHAPHATRPYPRRIHAGRNASRYRSGSRVKRQN